MPVQEWLERQLTVVCVLALSGLLFFRRNDARIGLYRLALQALVERPLTGYGPFDYQVRDRYSYPYGINSTDFFYNSAHNMILQIASEFGLPGLLVFGILITVAIRAVYQRWQGAQGDDRWLIAGAMAGLAALFSI